MYLEVKNVKKSYGQDGSYIQVLKGVNTGVEKGQMCVIQGTSGSGKSTLLNCIGGLDNMDSGSVKVDGNEIFGLSPKKLADYRRESLGFIFQFYNLVPNLTVKENIRICEYISQNPLNMDELLDTLGLTEHQNKFPSQLSGGQQQRCAIARALINTPDIVFADEPTGALNRRNTTEVLDLFTLCNKEGQSILMVTHDIRAALRATRLLYLEDGKIIGELSLPPYSPENEKSRETQVNSWLTSMHW